MYNPITKHTGNSITIGHAGYAAVSVLILYMCTEIHGSYSAIIT